MWVNVWGILDFLIFSYQKNYLTKISGGQTARQRTVIIVFYCKLPLAFPHF